MNFVTPFGLKTRMTALPDGEKCDTPQSDRGTDITDRVPKSISNTRMLINNKKWLIILDHVVYELLLSSFTVLLSQTVHIIFIFLS